MPPNLDVVLGGEELGESVVEGGKCGYAFVPLVLINIIGFFDFPNANFVILVSAE